MIDAPANQGAAATKQPENDAHDYHLPVHRHGVEIAERDREQGEDEGDGEARREAGRQIGAPTGPVQTDEQAVKRPAERRHPEGGDA